MGKKNKVRKIIGIEIVFITFLLAQIMTVISIRLNGHHVLVTINFSSKFISLLPSFFGKSFEIHMEIEKGKNSTKEEDIARNLVKSMNFHQSKKAILYEMLLRYYY